MNYLELIKPKYLSDKFLSRYWGLEAPFDPVGSIVYLRTYSRFIDELKRREMWWETCLRVVEYSISLAQGKIDHDELVEEAEVFYDYLFNLKLFPAGRTLWVGGSKQSYIDASGNWNCCFRNIDSISSFTEIMYWLMLGSGTGFSVEDKCINQLPNFHANKQVTYKGWENSKRGIENTLVITKHATLELEMKYLISSSLSKDLFNEMSVGEEVKIVVGDSKAGWSTATRAFIELLANPESFSLEVDLSNVRPAGERINIFGGRASGPKPLMQMLMGIQNTIGNSERLSAVQCLDICNYIGKSIVSGGVRRTSEIALCDEFNYEFVVAKENLWYDPAKESVRDIRSMSNNSIMYSKKPSREKIRDIMKVIRTNGDPGFWNRENSRRLAQGEIDGTNPCGEAALRDKQSCNLTTQNLMAFIKEEGGVKSIDWESLERSTRIVTRIGSRQTLCSQWHPEWDKVQKEERLLGVSFTGYGDLVEELKLSLEDQKALLVFIKKIALEEADSYHDKLGIERSFRVTLVKPEGTISLLPGVSSGLHDRYSPFYIRRMRISRHDPLALALKDFGFNPSPENGQGDDLYSKACDTWVFSFGVSSNTSRRAIDVPALEQLERYKLIQDNYCDRGHNASITVTVAEDEWNEVSDWVHDNWDSIIGITLLEKWDPEGDGKASHPQLPFESSTREKIEELNKATPKICERTIIDLLKKYETEYEEQQLEKGCETGACPVR